MDKLQAMSVFVKIAEKGSLTKAADILGKSLPAVVRILASLEQHLETRLFNRTTRKIALTEEGRIYLERCKKIITEIDDAENSLTSDQIEPKGTVTITASVRFGEMYVAPIITKFLKQYPKMHVKLLLLDRVVNMLDEGIDLAVRIAPIGDSSVIAKPVGEVRQVVCATPDLIDQFVEPQNPEDLIDKPCIHFSGLSETQNWKFDNQGKSFIVKIDGPLQCNQASSSVDACVAGMGFGQFLSYQVKPWIQSGELKIVLNSFEPKPIPVNIVFHHSRLMASRVRLFVDFLADELKSSLKENIPRK